MTPDVDIRPLVPKRTPRSLSRVKHPNSPLGRSQSRDSSISPLKRKRETKSSPLKKKLEVHIANKDSKAAQSLSKEYSLSSHKRKRETELIEQELLFDTSRKTRSSSRSSAGNGLPSPPTAKKAKIGRPFFKLEEPDSSFPVPTVEASPTSSSTSRQGSVATSVTDGQTNTDATSVDNDTIIVEARVTAAIPKARKPRGRKRPDPLEQAKSGETILVGISTTLQHPAVEEEGSPLSDLESHMFDDIDFETAMKATPRVSTRGSAKRIKNDPSDSPATKKRTKRASTPVMDKDHAPDVRIPGDYVLTPRLLAHPTSAWINCKICEEAFVQENAYFTRSSCPRCERHSKLYGYMWPKTDKEGRNDTEERVLDHRTVHRFIKPQEEKTARKRNRSVTGSRAVTREVSEVVVEEEKTRRGRRGRFTL